MKEMNGEERGILFDEKTLAEVRERFWRIDTDGAGKRRLFFENAGGSLRLKAVTKIADELNKFPDCYAREHKDSLTLQKYEARGKEDLRLLLNAKSGALVTDLTASALMFKIVGPMVEQGRGKNIVTSVLEHPSAYDACRYFAKKFGKELRVAPSNRKTGGIDAEAVLELVDKDTLMINVIAASNMTGAITDWQTIAQEARKINPDIYLVTDAVQHAPHGQIDFDGLGLDGVNIAPYKFLGNRGISFGFVSDRARALDHPRIIEDEPDIWELGSIVPAHYAALSAVVDYLAWLGGRYIEAADRRTLLVEGMRRIHLQERALLYRLLYGSTGQKGLLDMAGVDTFFDYSDLTGRDLILAMKLANLGYYEAVREYEKRGVIVFERVATSSFSRRMVESFGLDGIVRVSPLHCNSVEEIDEFLRITEEMLSL